MTGFAPGITKGLLPGEFDEIEDEPVIRLPAKPLRDVEEIVEELNSKIKGKAGQQVAAIRTHEINCGPFYLLPTSSRQRQIYRSESSIDIGELTDDKVKVEGKGVSGNVKLPTDRYATKSMGGYERKWRIEEGPIEVVRFFSGGEADILIGDEVGNYFASGKEFNMSYFDGLELLGIEIPERLKAHYGIHLHNKKVEEKSELVRKIESLQLKEARALSDIEDWQKSHYCDPSDSWNGRDSKEKAEKRIPEIHQEIRQILTEEFKKGALVETLYIPQEKPGHVIDYPGFLMAIAHKYKVELPK